MISFFIVGDTYDVYFGSDPPENLRIHLLNAKNSQYVRFNIFFHNRQRMDVYLEHNLIIPQNAYRTADGGIEYKRAPDDNPDYFHDQYVNGPKKSGSHMYNGRTKILSIIVKGARPIKMLRTEVVSYIIRVPEMSDDDAYDRQALELM